MLQEESRRIQRNLFYLISQKLGQRGQQVSELSKLLNIGKSALYSRINGKKLMSLHELMILAKSFDISLDEQISIRTPSVKIEFPQLNIGLTSASDFIANLILRLESASSLTQAEIQYISSEIPVFYYFKFRELSLFKLFIYEKAIWGDSKFSSDLFDFQELNHSSYDFLFKKLYNLYAKLPSEEIWSSDLVESTLNQLRYYAQSGILGYSKHTGVICDQLQKLVSEICANAKRGVKSDYDGSKGASFTLYHNDILRTNNAVIVKSLEKNQLYFTFDDPNYFVCESADLIGHSEMWFKKLQGRSQAVSNSSERGRLMMFNKCSRDIENAREFLKRFEV